MKFYIDKTGPVEKLQLRLNSAHVAYERLYQPLDPIEYSYPIDKPNSGTIIFQDSYEIDMLIKALNEFKEISQNYMGAWRPRS